MCILLWRYKALLFSCAVLVFIVNINVFASPIIPINNDDNTLYYKIGGASDYALPPVQNTAVINLTAGTDLSLGNQCGMFNPAVSIQNTLNNLQGSVNNLEQTIITSATGSITQMPMYFLAQANPTLYNLLNNALVGAHAQIEASMKSCQTVKDQIAHGKNPYQDWGTLSIGDLWKQHLSLTASGNEDINAANTEVTENAGENGVAWVQGKTGSDGTLRAGGQSQPPIHVVGDTIKAGYNAMLNRDLTSNDTAPTHSGLSGQFTSPQDAVNWVTNVLGDQIVTTCKESSCKQAQGGTAGRGLLPWATSCNAQNNNDCVDTLRNKLQTLVSGSTPVSKDSLTAVSADNLVISPQIIHILQGMDASQQGIFINKLAQEVAVQRLMNKALTARDLLQTGSQVPVVATNEPAQKLLQQARTNLDKNIESIAFTSQIRREMMSDTLSNLINYANSQQQQAFDIGKINQPQPLIENGAISNTTGAHK